MMEESQIKSLQKNSIIEVDSKNHNQNILPDTRNEHLDYQKNNSVCKDKDQQTYMIKLLMLILIRVVKEKTVEIIYLGTNQDSSASLDYVVLRYKLLGQDKSKDLILHIVQHNIESVSAGQILENNGLFSLHKYLDSFIRVKHEFTTNFHEKLDWNSIVYTTTPEDFSMKTNTDLIYTNEDDLLYSSYEGKTFNFDYSDEHLKILTKTALKTETKLLAEKIAHFIFTKSDSYQNMLLDNLIKMYHVFLAKRIINVFVIESEDFLVGKFNDALFDSDDDLMSIFRKVLYDKVIHIEKCHVPETEQLVKDVIKNPGPKQISQLIGSVLRYDDREGKLKIITQDNFLKHLTHDLDQVQVSLDVVEEAIEIAGRQKLMSYTFKLPLGFGNLDLEPLDNARLNDVVSNLISFLQIYHDPGNFFRIDENIVSSDCINTLSADNVEDLGRLLGDLLIHDESTDLLKFNMDQDALSEYSKLFFNKLSDEIQNNNLVRNKNLSDYRFDINITAFPKLVLTEDAYHQNLAKEFMQSVHFYTNQANEEIIDQVVKDYIKKIYLQNYDHGFDSESNADAFFYSFRDKIEEWCSRRIECSSLIKYFDQINVIMDDMKNESILSTLKYLFLNKITNCDIEYNEAFDDKLKLEDFELDSSKRVLIIKTNVKLLTLRKLVQKFAMKTNIDFLDLHYMYSLKASNVNNADLTKALSAWKEKKDGQILVIDSLSTESENTKRVFHQLFNLLKTNDKKIIIIIKDDDLLANDLKQHYFTSISYEEVVDNNIELNDLTVSSQNHILNKQIIFQGVKISLNSLLDSDTKLLVDGELICRLMNNDNLEIGEDVKKNSEYFETKEYYVDRTLVDQNSKEHCVKHYLHLPENVIIISGPVGMGKSTFLKHLTVQTKRKIPSFWIVNINLIDYTSELQNAKIISNSFDKHDALQILYKAVSLEDMQYSFDDLFAMKYREQLHGFNLLKIGLFFDQHIKRKMIIFVDGFDELNGSCKKKAIKLLQFFQIHKVKKLVVVISRGRVYQNELQQELKTCAYSLKPLSSEEQEILLKNFCKSKFNKLHAHKSRVVIRKMLIKIVTLTDGNFLSVPLRAVTVASFFKDNFEQIYDSFCENTDSFQEYKIKMFMAHLHEKLINKFLKSFNCFALSTFGEDKKSKFIENLKVVSFLDLYGENHGLNEAGASSSELKSEITKINKLFKFFSYDILDKQGNFLNLFYKQYFAAWYICDRIKLMNLDEFKKYFIEDIIKENKHVEVNYILSSREKINKFFGWNDKEQKIQIIFEYIEKQDYLKEPNMSLLVWIEHLESLHEKFKNSRILDVSNEVERNKLLLACAEMQYMNLMNYIAEKMNKEELRDAIIIFSNSLMDGRINDRVEVLLILMKRYAVDNSDDILQAHIFKEQTRNILKKCLRLAIVNSKPFVDVFGKQKLPLIEAIKANAPADAIEILLHETNFNIDKWIDDFDNYFHKNFLQYDIKISSLLVEKGFDLWRCLNVYLNKFIEVNQFIQHHDSLYGVCKKDFISCICNNCFHDQFSNLFSKIEVFLKSGSGFNIKMGQNTTLQYAEQMHFIYLFIKKIYKNNFENNYDVMSGILQLLIRDARRSSDVNNYELVIQTDVIMMYVGTKKIELFSMFYKLDAICDLSKYPAFHNVLSDNEYLRNFMKRVEYIHVVHGYCQKDAFDEACQQVARFEHIIRWILEQNSTKFQELDEVFAKLGFKNICIDKELEDLSSNINTFGIHFVNKIWSILIRVGPQKLSAVIKYLMTLLKQISKVYKLLKNLETSYDGLMDGIKNRNYKIVEYVLNCVEPDFVKSVIHGENMNCGSPLHYAASIGDANLCDLLLRFGANVNLNSNIDNLVSKDSVETKGANIDIMSRESITTNISPKLNPNIMNLKDSASSLASLDVEAEYVNIDNTSSEKITVLLKTHNGPKDVAFMKNCVNVKKKVTPLHCAVSNGHEEVVQILLKKFANVKSTNDMNETPLHIAALKGYEKIVEILLKAGAPIKVWDDNNMTPLHCAASNGHENVVRLILENLTSAADNSSAESPTPHVGSGQKPKNWFTDRKHLTPLYYAAKNSHRNVVKILINEYSKNDCVKVKKSPALNLMLKRDISIVVCGENIATLFMAIINNEKEAVQILIDNGIAVNITNEQDWTPLHVASTVGHSELLQLLIDKAAEVNVATDLKITPLHLAAHYGYKKIIEILLLNGAEVNSVASNDLTPLVMAFCGNHLETVDILLAHGADVHYRISHAKLVLDNEKSNSSVKNVWKPLPITPFPNTETYSLLHYMAFKNRYEMVEKLLNHGANINDLSPKECLTPLHISSLFNNENITKLLLQKGAKYNIKNARGKTPLDLARAESGSGKWLKSINQLFQAVRCGDVTKIEPLLENWSENSLGIILNARNSEDKTIVFYVATGGYFDILQSFMKK